LAPESAAGHKYQRTGKVLKASDVWSIGVIAYVLMTGRPPFNGRSNNEIFSAIIKKKIKFPTGVKLSKNFINLIKFILRKSPKQRMSLEEALKEPWVNGIAEDEPISKDVLRVLRQFAQQSKLKKAITKTLASHMGKEPSYKIKAHFSRLDKNGSGGLDASELSLLLQDMGITKVRAEEEAKAIISASDSDNSGEIEFSEFAQVWQRKLLSVNESYIHAVFTVLDENGDGTISQDELLKVLELNKSNPAHLQQVTDMIKQVDKDADGLLNFEEFKAAMLEVNDEGGVNLTSNNLGHKLEVDELNKHADGIDITQSELAEEPG